MPVVAAPVWRFECAESESVSLSMSDVTRPLRVLFVITGLDIGGAEKMLVRLLQRIDATRINAAVLTLTTPGALGREVISLGVPLHSLDLAPGKWSVGSAAQLLRIVRRLKPDVLQGWMYHGNLAAQFAAAFAARKAAVIWNIRGTITELARESFSTAAAVWLGARLSRFPTVVVNNSSMSAQQHTRRLGYSTRNVVIIPNGFDTDLYCPDSSARDRLRHAVGASDGDFLIGHVGRLHPMKDHETLLRAAAICIAAEPRARFVLVGADVDNRCRILHELAAKAGFGERLNYLGPREDVAQIMAGLDLFTLTSAYGEGFPNVIGEAMACAVPCVATDVGDSAYVIGPEGTIVPPGHAGMLADAWLGMMRLPPTERARMGVRARQRIIEHFSLAAIVQRYEDMYERVARQGSR